MKPIFPATDNRIDCMNECKKHSDCKNCPYYGLCESEAYFPYSFDGTACAEGEFVPADYIMRGNELF